MSFQQTKKKNPLTLEATDPQKICSVQARLAAFGVTNLDEVTTIVNVLDNHGLFHEVTTPKKGDTGKEIRRRAKRRAKELRKQIVNIRNGKNLAATPEETELAKQWPEIGAHQMELEKLKVLSETFQIKRGGRIIARLTRQENRNASLRGRRSEPEVTHALQILDRFLGEECSLPIMHRIECLGDILRKAMNLQQSREEVSEQVRWRLRDAKNKNPLHDVEYYEAIGVTYKTNDDRQERFLKCMSILASPQSSAEEKTRAENILEQQFSFS